MAKRLLDEKTPTQFGPTIRIWVPEIASLIWLSSAAESDSSRFAHSSKPAVKTCATLTPFRAHSANVVATWVAATAMRARSTGPGISVTDLYAG